MAHAQCGRFLSRGAPEPPGSRPGRELLFRGGSRGPHRSWGSHRNLGSPGGPKIRARAVTPIPPCTAPLAVLCWTAASVSLLALSRRGKCCERKTDAETGPRHGKDAAGWVGNQRAGITEQLHPCQGLCPGLASLVATRHPLGLRPSLLLSPSRDWSSIQNRVKCGAFTGPQGL